MALSPSERERLLNGFRALFPAAVSLSHVQDKYPRLYWVADPPRGISLMEHKLTLMDPLAACASALLPCEYESIGEASGAPPRSLHHTLVQPVHLLLANEYVIAERFSTLPSFVSSLSPGKSYKTMRVRGRVSGLWDLVQDSLVPNTQVYLAKYYPHDTIVAAVLLLLRATAETVRAEFDLGHIPISPFGTIERLLDRAETDRTVAASVIDPHVTWRSTLVHWARRALG